jgi:endoglucanase
MKRRYCIWELAFLDILASGKAPGSRLPASISRARRGAKSLPGYLRNVNGLAIVLSCSAGASRASHPILSGRLTLMTLRSRGLIRPRVLLPVAGVITALAVGLALAGGPGPRRIVDAGASTGCAVRYHVSTQWNTGFTAALTITNEGSPITSWTLRYAYAGGQSLAQGWSGTWTQRGGDVTVTSESWNGRLATGGSAQIGANFGYRGTNPAPAAFTVNGMTCTGSAITPVSPTTPARSPVPSPEPKPTATASAPAAAPPSKPAAPGRAPQLQVRGNLLVDARGQQVVLHGVDRSGTEFACVQNFGIFDGPGDRASIDAMRAFGVNAVRIPLNEACWNGESYVHPAYAGPAYRSAIEKYVSLLNASGMVAILDLHWTDGAYDGSAAACSAAQATCQKPMPDAAQAVPFWTSVARTFKGDNAVVFDLFNEPYPEQADHGDEAEGWQCWLRGGTCAGIGYPVAGMQSLVSAVRGTGASNVLMLGGLEWANDLTGWLAHEPADPDHDLAAAWHSYNFNACSTPACWTAQVAPVLARVPVIAGEIGENDCAAAYIEPLMSWLDAAHGSYLAWAWNTDFNCASGPGLISNYNGTPTAYGAGFESHISALAG